MRGLIAVAVFLFVFATGNLGVYLDRILNPFVVTTTWRWHYLLTTRHALTILSVTQPGLVVFIIAVFSIITALVYAVLWE